MRSIRVHYVLLALPALSAGIIHGASEKSLTQQTDTLRFTAVSVGGGHACGVTAAGAAYCWGDNLRGRLGDGTDTSRLRPVRVVSDERFAAVRAGASHTCALTVAGAAYCWGRNDDGELGDGTETDQHTPALVTGTLRFATISAGAWHTCAVTVAGDAYCWGMNILGELGDGTTTNRSSPVLVGDGVKFATVSAGSDHSCGITTAGAAYCWGNNGDGELGDGTSTRRSRPVLVAGGVTFAAVSAGALHSCGISTAGVTYCWGYNTFGQLGDRTGGDRSKPQLVAGGIRFVAVSAGNDVTCGVAADGVAYCWGRNFSGQLGDGTHTDRSSPVRVARGESFVAVHPGWGTFAGDHTCGVTAAGAVYCWGQNTSGQLGDGATTDWEVTPVPVAGTVADSVSGWAAQEPNPPGDPLSKLVGDWDLTTFVMGAGTYGVPRCGTADGSDPPQVTIAPPSAGSVSLSVTCVDAGEFAFRLRHDQSSQAYVLTVKSKLGISVQDLPVAYVARQGWQGKQDLMVNGEKRSITAMVAPIQGWRRHGWKIVVLPTSGIGREDFAEQQFFRVDLARRVDVH